MSLQRDLQVCSYQEDLPSVVFSKAMFILSASAYLGQNVEFFRVQGIDRS